MPFAPQSYRAQTPALGTMSASPGVAAEGGVPPSGTLAMAASPLRPAEVPPLVVVLDCESGEDEAREYVYATMKLKEYRDTNARPPTETETDANQQSTINLETSSYVRQPPTDDPHVCERTFLFVRK